MSIVYIGIGSNLGDRLQNCMNALELMGKKGISVKSKSSIYETEPWGERDQPRFLNVAVKAETGMSPAELLSTLQSIERELGREETYKWGPRSIDLDILLFDDLVMNEEGLRIPHPLMHVRDFVLIPLREIAPDVTHPIMKLSIKELSERLSGSVDRSNGHGIS